MTRLSWTQPVCDLCWLVRQPARMPTRLVEKVRAKETCCDCGEETTSGIYVRVDPTTVGYPKEED